ncbi:hypothetical protein EYF80_053646 [Liparis tanakae]|uniref:Uncharacterized protein n=1 Tax=Liparis tanakae TaxID=230148 RepID=A0A4Z2F4Z4_9TELE|nr:hypothetical protein EYF80_053646 [Liparis tanakae]
MGLFRVGTDGLEDTVPLPDLLPPRPSDRASAHRARSLSAEATPPCAPMMDVLWSSWDVTSPPDLAVLRESVYWLSCAVPLPMTEPLSSLGSVQLGLFQGLLQCSHGSSVLMEENR